MSYNDTCVSNIIVLLILLKQLRMTDVTSGHAVALILYCILQHHQQAPFPIPVTRVSNGMVGVQI